MNRQRLFWVAVAGLLAFAIEVPCASAQQLLKTTFFPEPATPPPTEVKPGPPLFLGKLFVQDSAGNWVPIKPRAPVFRPGEVVPPRLPAVAGGDVYVQDGGETSIGINYDDGNNLVAGYNTWPWNLDSHSNSTDGNLTWTSRTFPNGAGIFTGWTADPWTNAGNAAGEFFSTRLKVTSGFPPPPPFNFDSVHCIVARSTDGGASFSLFFEKFKAIFQDKEAVDIDKTTARGGGAGITHDGKVYLGYDDDGLAPNFSYRGSFLQVISSAGVADTEIQISGTGSPPFRGRYLQPVAGITDGTVYVKGHNFGSTIPAIFHEITNGGAGPNTFSKSSFSYFPAGQALGGSGFWGVNGHRIPTNIFGYLDIDRSSGPRRGYLYFITNRNPNRANPALDQGDVYLSVSTNGAASWSSALIPTAAGKTQYTPMLDVDEQGWIHIAYYQNETGSVNGGVLNASTANVYYTRSTDGGTSWAVPVQVNEPANALDYEDPPPNRSGSGYYLIGDYAQLQATGSGPSTKVYILWTGYDKDRSDAFVGDAKARVWCTTIQCFPRGDVTSDAVTDIVDIVALIQNVVFGDPLPNETAGDVNCDNVRDIVDIVQLIGVVALGQPTPCCFGPR